MDLKSIKSSVLILIVVDNDLVQDGFIVSVPGFVRVLILIVVDNGLVRRNFEVVPNKFIKS